MDLYLLAGVVFISLFGLFNLWGIVGFDSAVFQKQVYTVVIGVGIMFVFSFFNYRYFKDYSWFVLLFFTVSLILISLTFYSQTIRGIRAWIFLGNLAFEPSELAKLALVILLAKYFSQRHIYVGQIKTFIISMVYLALPAGLVLLQPDLGSAIILVMIWLGILLVSGINRKQIFILVILGVILGYGAWLYGLKPYQKARISSFLNPYSDPRGSGYNLIQSKIAIGSGHFFGNGWGKGSQARLGILPEANTDFIFASAVEQFGLAGAMLILGTFLFILYRCLRIGLGSSSNFVKLFSVGFVIFLFGHMVINIGANIGLLPITGIPLPFLSYGGSNYVSIMMGLGIMQSIKRGD